MHYEACENLQETVDKIHARGMKAGITIKPDTPVDVLVPYLDQAEMFLIMSVEPGKGGQKFIPESLEKIRTLRALLEERGLHYDIEVDGDRSRQRENGSGCRSQCDRSGIRRI